MSGTYEFRDAYKNVARDDMLQAMEAGAVSTHELIGIGESRGVFAGVTQGMISTLAKHGVIQSPQHGWWTLTENAVAPKVFRPETVGEVEMIGPDTTRVGEIINHKGILYHHTPEHELADDYERNDHG